MDLTCLQEREVEPALWKSVFYRPIEEFRRRIKAAAAAGEKGREPLHKVGHAQLSNIYQRRCCLWQIAALGMNNGLSSLLPSSYTLCR